MNNQNQSESGWGITVAIILTLLVMLGFDYFNAPYVAGAEQVAPVPHTQSCELWLKRHNTPATYPNE